MWTRRGFLAAAGVGFLAGLAPQGAEALASAELVFASAAKQRDGGFSAVLVSERGARIAALGLPDRGHDITQCPITGRLVAFARRPGTFAVVFTPQGQGITTITSAEGRHFFGHGVFSPDGQLLYATENDFDNAAGMIGIYDATNNFARIGEFSSGGMDPHDIMLAPDGKWLCVANGGIETHPDYGRAKLNLSTMRPNLTWIDRDTGTILATHELPQDLHQLSLRHLAIDMMGKVWVGGQFEGAKTSAIPLLASASLDSPLTFVDVPEEITRELAYYVGSVAVSPDGSRVVATSPVGNASLHYDLATGTASLLKAENVCGATWSPNGFAYSTGNGALITSDETHSDTGVDFDNHLLTLDI